MKIENLITVTGVEEVVWNPPKNKRLSYSEWLELKSDRIAECFSGVKIEADVLPWVNCYAEELVQLSWEHDVTLQSIVDKFTAELLLGKNPKTSLILTKESLENPCNYKLVKFSEKAEKPRPKEPPFF